MKLTEFMNIFGLAVLGLLLIFLASSGGRQTLVQGPGAIARGYGQFFGAFSSAVGGPGGTSYVPGVY